MDWLIKKKTRKLAYKKKNKEDAMKDTKALHNGLSIIMKAFEKRVFTHLYCPDNVPYYELSDTHEDDSCFYTPREVTPRNAIPTFDINALFEDEQPDTTDMPRIRKRRICCTKKKSTRIRCKNTNTKSNAL